MCFIMLIYKTLAIFALLVTLFGNVSFAQVDIESYDMIFTLTETSADAYMEIDLGNSTLSSMSFSTDDFERFAAYDSKGPLEYKIGATENGETTQVFLRGDNKLYLEFSSKKFVFTSGEIKQFFADVSLEFNTKQMNVVVKLPVGYITDSHFPRGVEISSDGSRIILSWNFENPTTNIISVRFKKSENLNAIPIVASVVIAIVAALFVYYYKRRSYNEFLEGFSDDEVKVIQFMKKSKQSYQNIIEKEFHFSRAKMTRITTKLEQKYLIQKKKKGRTNKLTWIRGKTKKAGEEYEKNSKSKIKKEQHKTEDKNKPRKQLKPNEEQIVKDMFGE